jgi:hypothetical protein
MSLGRNHYIIFGSAAALGSLVFLLSVLGTALFLITVLFLVLKDIRQAKAPYDKAKKPFNLRVDWWVTRWDDVAVWVTGGAIGAVLSSEIGTHILDQYIDFSVLAEDSLNNTVVILCTLLGAKFLEKALSK